MKNLVIKSTIVLFVCLCITSFVQAECKPCSKGKEAEKKETVVQRIKNKISQITGKNKSSTQIDTEKTESENQLPCESEQCSENCTDVQHNTLETASQNNNETIIETPVAVIVTDLLEAAVENLNPETKEDVLFDNEVAEDEHCNSDGILVEEDEDDEFKF